MGNMCGIQLHHSINVQDICVVSNLSLQWNEKKNEKKISKMFEKFIICRLRERVRKKSGVIKKWHTIQSIFFPTLYLPPPPHFILAAHHSFSPHCADLQWNDNNIYHMERILSFDFFDWIYGFVNGWWNVLSYFHNVARSLLFALRCQ